MRADEFVMKHVKFISGRLKLTNVNFQNDTKDVTEPIQYNEGNIEYHGNNAEIKTTDNVIDKDLENECTACKNADLPSGAHKCYICQKNIHALDACSAPVGEEGYGQKRICRNCQKIHNM
jgi:hypothetical protein